LVSCYKPLQERLLISFENQAEQNAGIDNNAETHGVRWRTSVLVSKQQHGRHNQRHLGQFPGHSERDCSEHSQGAQV